MYKIIPQLLEPASVESLLETIGQAAMVDGGATTKNMPVDRKQNEQVPHDSELAKEAARVVGKALQASRTFTEFAMPLRLAPATLSRYGVGMYYDRHVDAPIMGQASKMRTDLSITVFLSPPDSYDGGELIIDWEFGEHSFKLDAGDAIVYETSAHHEVTEVTRGERIVAVSWIQSLLRYSQQRKIMRDLQDACSQVMQAAPDSEVVELLNSTYSNLLRMWSDI